MRNRSTTCVANFPSSDEKIEDEVVDPTDEGANTSRSQAGITPLLQIMKRVSGVMATAPFEDRNDRSCPFVVSTAIEIGL